MEFRQTMEVEVDDYKGMQDYFAENKYVVIRSFISTEMATLLYSYCLSLTRSIDFKIMHDKSNHCPDWDGNFHDPQVPGSFVRYGDPMMDSLLVMSTESMSKFTGLSLQPNYAYWRLYQKYNVLARHRDRDSCEISTTLCLGYDVSNVDHNVYPDYDWPMFVESKDHPDGLPIHLKPGDMIIYRGCDVDHWRQEFPGLNHAQVFMHYNDTNGPFCNYLDGRPIPGIPKKFQKE